MDIEAVRFLNDCEARGIELMDRPAYVREWMVREKIKHKDGAPWDVHDAKGPRQADLLAFLKS